MRGKRWGTAVNGEGSVLWYCQQYRLNLLMSKRRTVGGSEMPDCHWISRKVRSVSVHQRGESVHWSGQRPNLKTRQKQVTTWTQMKKGRGVIFQTIDAELFERCHCPEGDDWETKGDMFWFEVSSTWRQWWLWGVNNFTSLRYTIRRKYASPLRTWVPRLNWACFAWWVPVSQSMSYRKENERNWPIVSWWLACDATLR